jgi:hypothetical protein
VPLSVIHQQRSRGRAEHKGDQRKSPAYDRRPAAQNNIVGGRRNDSSHVRGVLTNGQKTSGVEGSGHQRQRDAEMKIRPCRSQGRREAGEIIDRHQAFKVTTSPTWIEPTRRGIRLTPKFTLDSTLRTFYYEPKHETLKINDDAIHLLCGIEHDGNEGAWTFTRFHLIDLSKLRVRLKAEFQASNADIYPAK